MFAGVRIYQFLISVENVLFGVECGVENETLGRKVGVESQNCHLATLHSDDNIA